eukprot:29897_1
MSSPAESALCAIEKSTAIPLIDFAKQVVQKIYESDEITSIVCDAIKKQNYEDTDDLLDDIEDRNNSILMYMISKAIENTQSIVYKWNNEDSNNLCEILTKIYRDDVTDVNQYNKVVSKSGDVNTLMFTSVDDALSYYDRQLNAVFELHPSTMTTETSVNSVTNNMLKSKSKIIKQTKERNDIKAREANQKRQNQQNKQNVGKNIHKKRAPIKPTMCKSKRIKLKKANNRKRKDKKAREAEEKKRKERKARELKKIMTMYRRTTKVDDSNCKSDFKSNSSELIDRHIEPIPATLLKKTTANYLQSCLVDDYFRDRIAHHINGPIWKVEDWQKKNIN